MENFKHKEDPVISEIRKIREEISQITADLDDEELVAWYKAEAQKSLALLSKTEEQGT